MKLYRSHLTGVDGLFRVGKFSYVVLLVAGKWIITIKCFFVGRTQKVNPLSSLFRCDYSQRGFNFVPFFNDV
jgi:hypothetical protein